MISGKCSKIGGLLLTITRGGSLLHARCSISAHSGLHLFRRRERRGGRQRGHAFQEGDQFDRGVEIPKRFRRLEIVRGQLVAQRSDFLGRIYRVMRRMSSRASSRQMTLTGREQPAVGRRNCRLPVQAAKGAFPREESPAYSLAISPRRLSARQVRPLRRRDQAEVEQARSCFECRRRTVKFPAGAAESSFCYRVSPV